MMCGPMDVGPMDSFCTVQKELGIYAPPSSSSLYRRASCANRRSAGRAGWGETLHGGRKVGHTTSRKPRGSFDMGEGDDERGRGVNSCLVMYCSGLSSRVERL